MNKPSIMAAFLPAFLLLLFELIDYYKRGRVYIYIATEACKM